MKQTLRGDGIGVRALLAFLAVASAALGFTVALHLLAPAASPITEVQQAIVPPPQQVFGRNNVRVLVVGLDYDYNHLDEETSAQSRSDIIMAVNLDLLHRRIYELSVPRDMVATLPNGQQAKINQAQSDGGIQESQKVVSQFLGIPGFDRYVVLRIDTMKDLINAIGGVTVDVKNSDALKGDGPNGPLDYDDSWGHLHVHLKPGVQHLSGDQAVGYARFRHDWCSDPCRIMRQQQVIHAIVAQIEHHKLNTLLHAQALLDVMRKDVQTNLRPQEELSLAMAYAQATPKDIVMSQVPYVSDVYLPNYGDCIIPDESAKRHLVATLLGVGGPVVAGPRPTAVEGYLNGGTGR